MQFTPSNERDEYVQIGQYQNAGGECPYCYSDTGHFAYCVLINQAAAKEVEQLEELMVG